MNKIIAQAVLAALASTAMIAAPAYAFTNPDRIGNGVTSTQYDRTIAITPATRWVNVAYGEVVNFEVQGGDSFAWHFSGIANNVSLKDIDPKAGRDLKIYVDQSNNSMNETSGD